MNWTAVGAVGELLAAAAVLVTLVYLARQVRQSNRQDMLNAYRHTYDSLNDWAMSLVQSEEISAITLRGRASYGGLNETERFRFDHVHMVLLNIIEAHYYQVQRTAMDEAYRRWALENLDALVRGYLDFPGVREFWQGVQQFYEPAIRELVARNLGRT